MFDAINIRSCEEYIISIQRKLDRAVADNDKSSIRQLFDLLTNRSKAVRMYATWKITRNNQGKYTAGVDGVALPRKLTLKDQDMFRHSVMNKIDTLKKPDKIRRVYIPKPNGKKRPLGIPTIHDRIVQEIYRIALDPIVEYHFSGNSYGFRPKRSCHDARGALFLKLSRKTSYRYIIEGDIKGCFDNIKHNHITETLDKWLVPNWAIEYIMKILKSKIFENGLVYDSETGTPQGGVISPMLANVALTSLDNLCDTFTRHSNPIVRYADDFVIVCQSELEAKERKEIIAEHLLEKAGLTLSEEKTNITHITKGFNFLAFNFRKYKSKMRSNDEVLLIKPPKEKVVETLRDWKGILKSNKAITTNSLISILRPKMLGWGMYYRHSVSKQIFSSMDYKMWFKLLKWIRHRHPNKSTKWLINNYFYKKKGTEKSYYFVDKTTGKSLPKLSQIPIKRFIKINNKYRVYCDNPETKEYWSKREYQNAFGQIWSIKTKRLYKKQQGKCFHCKSLILDDDIANQKVHIHHLIPKAIGGTDTYSNLRVVHEDCHKDIHKAT
jgi:RNA-directed DNA polymerase